MYVPCPSGFVFDARKWRLGDIQSLIKRKEDPGGLLPLRMVELAGQTVVDPGPYPFKPDEPIDWRLVSHADIACANIGVRCLSDPLLVIQPNCGACGKLRQDALEIELLDQPIYPASDEGKEHLSTGNPIAIEVQGHSIVLKALRGEGMATMAKLQEQEPEAMLEILTCMGIAAITTVDGKQLNTIPEVRAFVREQDFDFGNAIDTELDVLFGGVDMSYRFTCDHIACRTEQEQTVPLDLRFYGLDPEARQQRRASRSSGATSLRTLMQR